MGFIQESDVQRLMQDESLMSEIASALVENPDAMEDLADDIADKLDRPDGRQSRGAKTDSGCRDGKRQLQKEDRSEASRRSLLVSGRPGRRMPTRPGVVEEKTASVLNRLRSFELVRARGPAQALQSYERAENRVVELLRPELNPS